MKYNGSCWCTVSQFVRQYIHLYNYQILQMIQDYRWFQNLTLTSIGYCIMGSHTAEYQEMDVPSFTLMAPKMKHDMTQGRTYLTATLALDKKVADTYEAELSWRHHNHDNTVPSTILYPFNFWCELHVHLCDSVKCPCICINLLLEHFCKHNSEETFQCLPIRV